VEIQHPRAELEETPDPPAQVSIPGHGNVDVVDGVLDVPEDIADQAMRALCEAYGVAYKPGGEVVREEDEPPNDVGTAADTTNADAADDGICGTEMSDGTICERPAGECPYHGED